MKLFTFERTLHDLTHEQINKGAEVVCKTERGICKVFCSNGITITGNFSTLKITVEKQLSVFPGT